jgi:hypothetical protein
MADYNYKAVDSNIENNRYGVARNIIEDDKKRIYSPQDTVLYNLDVGVLSHYAGEYTRSNNELTQAEIDIFNNFAVSISESINAWITNDTVMTYQGETYEDIYTNIFMALNYLQMNNISDAFVEIRRFDNKLKEITAKYQVVIAQAKQNAQAGVSSAPDSNMEFHNSALARYLSMIMYRAEGRPDQAEVDRKLIESAFMMQPRLYPFPAPKSIADEITIPQGKARLNILALTGRAPIKQEETSRIWSPDGSFYYKLALPVMSEQFSRVQTIECRVVDSRGGIAGREKLELLENISAIAMDTFKQRQSVIYFRSVARSIAKSATGAIASSVAKEQDSLLGALFSLFSLVTTEVSERADVRTSKFFPGKVSIAGITLDPGAYTVQVDYLSAGGSVLYEQTFNNVIITQNKLNLVESLCIK